MNNSIKVLVTGACGQLGSEITSELRQKLGMDAVIATDVAAPHLDSEDAAKSPFFTLDVCDANAVKNIIATHGITHIYHLAAILSGNAEKNPNLAWAVNIQGFMNVLDAAKDSKTVTQIYFPSSIAVFGPTTPKKNTPQVTVTEPTTVYGITKLVGERLCQYYFNKYNLDVRCLRYPGIISYKTLPGGGTTDYAVDIYHQAIKSNSYQCFLSADTYLPMMYMPDALKATFDIMAAPPEKIKCRGGYNLGAMSFSPIEITASIAKLKPGFTITYQLDFRQAIADSWPNSIDDSAAQQDWGWHPSYDLDTMTADMLTHISQMQNKVLV